MPVDLESNAKERIISVDILRGIASLGVCIFHINNHVFLTAPPGIVRALFIGSGFVGGLGVDMFLLYPALSFPIHYIKLIIVLHTTRVLF